MNSRYSRSPNSPPPRAPYDAPEPVMRAAGAWLARRDRGFTADESAAFEKWIRADAHHAAAVAQLEQTMNLFDRLGELAPASSAGSVRARTHHPDADAFAPPRRTRGSFFPSLAAAGVAAALALVVWRAADRPTTPTHWHYATAAATYERATLPDGSTVELNGDTTIDVEFTATERRVRLSRGEAHFHVAKIPARPFIVSADGVAFRAVGTAFSVRLDQANVVEMLVTEGKVQVEPAAPDASSTAVRPASAPSAFTAALPLLTAGHRIVVPAERSRAPTIVVLSAEEIERTLAWQPRVAEFRKTPLSEVVAEFNRRNHPQIVIADPALHSLRIGGNFRVDQPDAFVRLLETSFGIVAERAASGGSDVITLRQAP